MMKAVPWQVVVGLVVVTVAALAYFGRARGPRRPAASRPPQRAPGDAAPHSTPTWSPLEGVSVKLTRREPSVGARRRFLLEYGADAGRSALDFEYEIPGLNDAAPTTKDDDSFLSGVVAFERAPGGGSTALCVALAAMHGSTTPPPDVAVIERLEVDATVLGRNLSEGVVQGKPLIAGKYSGTGSGSWTVLKLFFPESGAESEDGEGLGQPEIFLAIDESAGVACFEVKDTDYWPSLAPYFAALTGPRR